MRYLFEEYAFDTDRRELHRKTVAELLEIEPHFRISEWVARTGIWLPQIYIDGLRKAGLPE